jgi:4-carboxymuconolactone decarboxylase
MTSSQPGDVEVAAAGLTEGSEPASRARPGGSATSTEPTHEELLRRLALNDEQAVGTVVGPGVDRGGAPALGEHDEVLVRLSALVAIDAAPASYQCVVAQAFAAGVTEDALVSVLVAVAPVVGAARVHAAAGALGVALGYDQEATDC